LMHIPVMMHYPVMDGRGWRGRTREAILEDEKWCEDLARFIM